MVTYLEPDFNAVDESQLNRWRVFNGENWVHGFDDKERAIDFAKRNGGTRVAYCKKVQREVCYVSPMRV